MDETYWEKLEQSLDRAIHATDTIHAEIDQVQQSMAAATPEQREALRKRFIELHQRLEEVGQRVADGELAPHISVVDKT